MKFTEGIVTFKGCCWDAKWEFDFPTAIYSPIRRYGMTMNIVPDSFRQLVVDACEELCLHGQTRSHFTKEVTKTFEQNKWSFNLARKKNAIHGEITVHFYMDKDIRKYAILN